MADIGPSLQQFFDHLNVRFREKRTCDMHNLFFHK